MKEFILDFIRGPIVAQLDSVGRVNSVDASSANISAAEAQTRINRLALLCEAMFELINEKMGISEEDLARKVHEIDMRDGKADGKYKPQLQKCVGCERTMAAGRTNCLYCGAVIVTASFKNI